MSRRSVVIVLTGRCAPGVLEGDGDLTLVRIVDYLSQQSNSGNTNPNWSQQGFYGNLKRVCPRSYVVNTSLFILGNLQARPDKLCMNMTLEG